MLITVLAEFATLTLRVVPYFLLGAVAGAAFAAYLPARWSTRLFGGEGSRGLFGAVAAGALLPGCSCATMPMAAGLRAGARSRLGTVAAFIMVSPLLSPITVALTWGMIGWPMAVARTVAALAGSILLGIVINRFEGWFAAAPPAARSALPVIGDGPVSANGPAACEPPAAAFWPELRRILRTITPYFLLGMAIAAGLAALLPEAAIPRLLGGSAGVPAYLLAAVVGIPIYVCEGEEVPITFALLARGLGPGPALTFLLGSVGTCIPTVLMARRVIGPRATTFYLGYWFAFAIGAGVLFQLLS